MSMGDVAAMAEVHVSTVSRAIRGKYLQYKNIILLRDLFTGSVGEHDGDAEISSEAIMGRIRELIQAEEKPLSDASIAERLKAEGMEISRRTVAKYRARLGFLDSRQRAYVGK